MGNDNATRLHPPIICGILLVLFLTIGCGGRRVIPPDPSAQPSEVFTWPLQNAELLSPFGPRGRTHHTGMDIRGRHGGGDAVFAARAGKVTIATRRSGYGLIVELTHEDGYKSRYAHLKRILVRPGQQVNRQEPIGIVGSTGRASTAHLHFEILSPQNRFLNPEHYLRQNEKKSSPARPGHSGRRPMPLRFRHQLIARVTTVNGVTKKSIALSNSCNHLCRAAVMIR